VKIACTLISAAISAIAGALYAPLIGIAFPAMFGVLPNMLVLIWIAIGGTGTLLGPFVAGFVLTLVQFELGSQLVNWYLLVMGIVFVTAVVWAPAGVWRFGGRAGARF
jgi:ABC-type branched-subunit amino acid transport system permease subunit